MKRNREDRIGGWVSVGAERKFLAAYDALSGRWPTPPDQREIPTEFGPTHVFCWAGTGSPTVLLHGGTATSHMWHHLAPALGSRPIYALDTVGDAGRSVQRAPIRNGGDFAVWLNAVLDGLGLSRVTLVGSSMGGWLALNQALRSPDRLAAICLVDPVLGKISPRFYLWGLACGLALPAPPGVRRRAARWLHHGGVADAAVLRLAYYGMRKHRWRLPMPVPLTDQELCSITTPTLLLLAEKSQIHRPNDVMARAGTLMPSLEAHIIPGVGHSLGFDRADEVAAYINRFLASNDGVAAST